MKSTFDVLGNHIRLVDKRNRDMITDRVVGINIDKYFMPSVANVIGTDLSKYKLISKGLFACNPMHVGRDERLPVALYTDDEPSLVSPAYFMFEIKDNSILDDEFLMMWFRRKEFDRICWLKTDGSVRGGISWEDICRIEFPLLPILEQKQIVRSYNAISDRIEIKRQLNDNLNKQIQSYHSKFKENNVFSDGTLKEHCTMQYGYTEVASSEQIGPKFLRITDIAQDRIEWNNVPYCQISDVNHKKYVLSEGDIVVARTGATVGAAKMMGNSIPDAVFASFLVRIIPNNEKMKYYLGNEITSFCFLEYVQTNAGGSAQPQANPPLLGEYCLKIPNEEFLTEYNNIVKPFLKAREINENEISKLNLLKTNFIDMLSSR